MTENDPSGQNAEQARPAGAQPDAEQSASWAAQPASSPPDATGLGGHAASQGGQAYPTEQQYNPWSPQAQQTQTQQAATSEHQAQGTYTQGHQIPGQQTPYGQHAQPGPSVYAVPQQRQASKSTSGKLLAGVAAIALVVGGVAGGTVGYLTGDASGGNSVNALDAPKPAQQTGNVPAGSVESVAQKLSPSVVELQVSGRAGAGEGSGFVLSTDGYVLTNNHVVEVAAGGGQIQAVFQDGKKGAATIVGRDPTTDIAVVKVSGVSGLTPVELGRSDDLRVGQPVVAIGSPFELAGTVTSGIVSALNRPVSAGGNGDQTTVMSAVQTDAAINPGNSGGPLANMSGQVIGINSAIYSPKSAQSQGGESGGNVGIGFAIPIDQARRTADDIINTGRATQTFIGARVQTVPTGGAQLGEISPGSPAEKAGLKSGDVVTKLDDRPIPDADALVAAIRTRAPNDKVKFTLSGDRVVEVTLGGQPVTPN
ncbi:S1C family serine protease [Amycolatopsis regifaucium]|uniref:Serine protease n=1 Tax=Amycolatopsis regifaucium TaxID=546365 RepID=A0A154MV95_9PSEU|nr:trypsin-like peptidase domain-containing protein [Amycolatopsis regifaucium]KZB87409.1 serine protease [Amycolatopsis regifaucium]OKA08244.1 serine protease [Amycolatopsis regifaucium]SFI44939.1 putative serine protease PepD [Amycolatopsis regifaucium]